MGPIWPLALYFLVVVVLVSAILGLSYVLGQRHRERATAEFYEGGIKSAGTARVRLSERFYLVAMFFVIFDLEAVFLFAWAIAVRELGWPGYWEIVIFIGLLVTALAYLWKLGGLDWSAVRSHTERI